MLTQTVNGKVFLGQTSGISAGKPTPFGICYDPTPDNDHCELLKINLNMYPIEDREVDNYIIYMAYLTFYGKEIAFHKLQEIGIINA